LCCSRANDINREGPKSEMPSTTSRGGLQRNAHGKVGTPAVDGWAHARSLGGSTIGTLVVVVAVIVHIVWLREPRERGVLR
jgi:hypothetical protein